MRLKIINPNTMDVMTRQIGEKVRQAARIGTEWVAVNPPRGPLSIEGFYDHSIAAVQVLEEILREKGKYDAYIIACFGDPGLEAAREITDVPVIGICEAALHVACLLAPRFSILTVLPRVIVELEDLVAKYGLKNRLASVRASHHTVEDTAKDPEKVQRALIQEGRKAIVEDRAEALLLGCAGMSRLDEEMEKELKVPVIDGVAAAVKLAEALLDLGKKTSKVNSYKYPEQKEFKGMGKIFQP